MASTDKAELAAVELSGTTSEEQQDGGKGQEEEEGGGERRLFEGHQTVEERRDSFLVRQHMKVHCG